MTPPATITIQAPDEEATLRVSAALALVLAPGHLVTLSGELGAGKTCLVRGVAAALGIPANRVSSPTFTLAHVYGLPIPRMGGVSRLVHIDAYRLHGPEDVDSLGIDALWGPDAVVFLEWPERLLASGSAGQLSIRTNFASLSDCVWSIRLIHATNGRLIEIDPPHHNLGEALRAALA